MIGRDSPYSLYDQDLVTFEEGAVAYDHRDAAGFIKLNALRLRTLGQRKKNATCNVRASARVVQGRRCRSCRCRLMLPSAAAHSDWFRLPRWPPCSPRAATPIRLVPTTTSCRQDTVRRSSAACRTCSRTRSVHPQREHFGTGVDAGRGACRATPRRATRARIGDRICGARRARRRFFAGQISQFLPTSSEQCGKAVYGPFPELEKICVKAKCT